MEEPENKSEKSVTFVEPPKQEKKGVTFVMDVDEEDEESEEEEEPPIEEGDNTSNNEEGVDNNTNNSSEDNTNDATEEGGKDTNGEGVMPKRPKFEVMARRGNFAGPLCVLKNPGKRKVARSKEDKKGKKKTDDSFWDCPECTYKNNPQVETLGEVSRCETFYVAGFQMRDVFCKQIH